MTRRARSLRNRLLRLAAFVLVVVLAIAGFGLNALFHSHLEKRAGQELDTQILQIIGNLRLEQDGTPSLARQPADPRFEKPYGGLYWQVTDTDDIHTLRSRSLWDETLNLPDDRLLPGQVHEHEIAGPRDSSLLLHEQLVLIAGKDREHPLRVSVAVDRAELNALGASFGRDTAIALSVLGIVLLAGFAFQVHAGLRPVDLIQNGITRIRDGSWRRFEGDVPGEIRPLVSEINALLEVQEKQMIRAQDRAADLAHGLKTPLTALSADIRKLRASGQDRIADDIEAISMQMTQHVERELIKARFRHLQYGSTEIKPVVDMLVKTLKRLPRGEEVNFETDIDDKLQVGVGVDDLNEIVGNLAENAIRFAASKVRISAKSVQSSICLVIEDDGPGLGKDEMAMMLDRGKRLDERGNGAGLGMAIVHDILEEIGGHIEVGRSSLGGLAVVVQLRRS